MKEQLFDAVLFSQAPPMLGFKVKTANPSVVLKCTPSLKAMMSEGGARAWVRLEYNTKLQLR